MAAQRMSMSERIYRFMVTLYPRKFRERYGREMRLLFRDRLRESKRERGWVALFSLWARTLADFARSAPMEYLTQREHMAISHFSPWQFIPAPRTVFKYGVRAFAGLIVAVALWLPIGNALANRSERLEAQAWSRVTGRNAESIVDEYSRIETNETARFLDAQAQRLYHEGDHTFQALDQVANGYLADQLRRPNDQIDEPPSAVQHFITEHKSELVDLYQRLESREAPVWKFEPVRNSQPSAFYFRAISTLIALDILNSIREGRDRDASRNLDTFWKVNRSLLERPDLIAQLVGMDAAGTQMGLLRKMHNVPSKWQDRVRQHRFSDNVIDAIQIDHFCLQLDLNSGANRRDLDYSFVDGSSLLRNLGLTWVGIPYTRLCVADDGLSQLKVVTTLRGLNIDSVDFPALRRQAVQRAAWNLIDRPVPSPADIWRNAIGFDAAAEFTSQVLRVKQSTDSGADWRDRLPKNEQCQFGTWAYAANPSGSVTVELKGAPAWLSQLFGIVLSYTVEPHGPERRSVAGNHFTK